MYLSNKRKRGILFSCFLSFFLVLSSSLKSQKIIRFSDNKEFTSITISNNKDYYELFNYQVPQKYKLESERVFHNNKYYEFIIENNSLIFFDRMAEIEPVNITNNLNKKEIVNVTSRKRGHICTIYSVIEKAIFADISNLENKNIYLKSIYLYPNKIKTLDGNLIITLYRIKDGLPDNNGKIIEFSKEISAIKKGATEIVLPKIVKIPKEGFFISLTSDIKKLTKIYESKCTKDSHSFQHDPNSEWIKIDFPAFQIKLKLLL